MSVPAAAAYEAPATDRATFKTYRLITFVSLIVGYMGYYLCRKNFSSAFEPMHASLGLTKATFGNIASAGTLVYAIGKLVSGPWTDKLGGRIVFFVGLFGSVVATVGIGATGPVVALYIFWLLNRAFQSMGWGGLVNVLSRWFSAKDYGTAAGALSVSYQAGDVVAGLFCGVLISQGFGWRTLFFAPAGLLALLGVALLFTLHGHPRDVGCELVETAAADRPAPAKVHETMPMSARILALLSRPAFIVVCVLSFALTLIRECFTTWMPVYFSDLGNGSAAAVFKSTLFPLLGCVGTLAAGWISDRLASNRGPILVAFLVGATACLLGLAFPGTVAVWLHVSQGTVAAALVGATGFFILAPYSMAGGGALALDHGGPQMSATAANFLDFVGYLGATLAGLGVAQVVSKMGWGTAYELMAGASLLSAVLCLFLKRPR